ncbi:flagellar basal body-associated FliL family protein [Deltaproteobacteria bacterium OttesenSCG-928-K17]|nr:flagellar basal body-associated FliL family protein [Deltaproteobacteria bacterium OttesenSCG-928-K17]
MAKKEKTPPAPEAAGGDSGTEAAAPKKGGKLKLILMVVGAMVIGAGLAFGALTFFGGGSSEPAAVAENEAGAEDAPAPEDGHAPPVAAPTDRAGDGGHGAAPAEGEGEAQPEGPQIIEFKPFTVNLNDAGGKRFLRLTMSLEVTTAALGQEVNTKMPQFRDTILLLLSSLSYDDIATLDGKMRLRNQMLNRINSQLTSGKIRNIYFSEFVVQ